MFKRTLPLCVISKHLIQQRYLDVRVRFAPSPTGYLHLGGLRTALFNYLFAHSRKGVLILRIEDTDQTRVVDGATEALVRDLEWTGIRCDEGPTQGGSFGPYVQSERREIYKEHVEKLLDNGSAYRCFCSSRRIDLLKREAVRTRQMPKYDNKCRSLTKDEINSKISNGETYCVRFKLSSDCSTFEDMVYGSIAYDVSLGEGDPVIMKSDGYPTYHLANVVDDHLMKITHVLRGVEWQISTTKHLLLYKAFGWKPPFFGHLPLIMNSDGSKLSKRQGDIRVEEYRKNGILPGALVNYITLAGGGFDRIPGEGIIPYTIKELAKQFKIERVNVNSSRLDPILLTECNRLELKEQMKNFDRLNELTRDVQRLVNTQFGDKNVKSTGPYIQSVLKWSSGRITQIDELLTPKFAFLWVLPNKDTVVDDALRKDLDNLCLKLKNVNKFENSVLKETLQSFSKENNIKFNVFMKSLRKVLSGLDQGPGVSEMMEILGKHATIERLKCFVK